MMQRVQESHATKGMRLSHCVAHSQSMRRPERAASAAS
eukprot:CAMPEP_0175290460 /NCGR_PEP_ID=MMETSP0093-20121207/55885_1 /TAXON_ID=311494 /ORGANISM="Alexandrium monilatum, Strain CCMP3105" /LENGTH=37 /DNA_ID= /DNA_START= /DNA_END= /DNA_ORIENTATION=